MILVDLLPISIILVVSNSSIMEPALLSNAYHQIHVKTFRFLIRII